MGIMGRGHDSSSEAGIVLSSTSLEAGRPASEEEGDMIEYKKVVWKDFITKKKYIRTFYSVFVSSLSRGERGSTTARFHDHD